ncbi:MAG: ComF family protein [Candidatus Cloacimonetes bacterium]|nr:ComF family protein [Candidatus Cloacimonadota bacterium]
MKSNQPLCPICAEKLKEHHHIEFSDEQKKEFYFTEAYAGYEYNKIIRNLIHEFKYKEMTLVGNYLMNMLFSKLPENFLEDIDYIVPIPLHKVKKRARGFNQSEILSNSLSELSHIPTLNIINRAVYTKTQTKLSKNERKSNVKNVFVLNKNFDISKKGFVIVDDVFTTGSTANEAAKVLKDHNAEIVKVLVLATAKHQ